VGILGRRNYTGTIWDFREIIFGLPGTIGKTLQLAQREKTAETVSDRLKPCPSCKKKPFETVSDRLKPCPNCNRNHQTAYAYIPYKCSFCFAVIAIQSQQISK
jgi:ribosomal protein L37AE/L43A